MSYQVQQMSRDMQAHSRKVFFTSTVDGVTARKKRIRLDDIFSSVTMKDFKLQDRANSVALDIVESREINDSFLRASESSLKEIWDTPEEDAAWAYLQQLP